MCFTWVHVLIDWLNLISRMDDWFMQFFPIFLFYSNLAIFWANHNHMAGYGVKSKYEQMPTRGARVDGIPLVISR